MSIASEDYKYLNSSQQKQRDRARERENKAQIAFVFSLISVPAKRLEDPVLSLSLFLSLTLSSLSLYLSLSNSHFSFSDSRLQILRSNPEPNLIPIIHLRKSTRTSIWFDFWRIGKRVEKEEWEWYRGRYFQCARACVSFALHCERGHGIQWSGTRSCSPIYFLGLRLIFSVNFCKKKNSILCDVCLAAKKMRENDLVFESLDCNVAVLI